MMAPRPRRWTDSVRPGNAMSPDRRDGFPELAREVEDRLVVVQDAPSPCPYIDGFTARMPLHFPVAPLTPDDTDVLLAGGFRRSGTVVYYTRCEPCFACEPTRLRVADFQPGKSFKRIWNRGERELTAVWQSPRVDGDRVRLYNRHRRLRDLGGGEPVTAGDYQAFLTHSCWQTVELEIRDRGDLIAVSIMDVGRTSVSAVYTYFEPGASRFSPGTLAVLHQIDWARRNGRAWVYLGLYVASNPHLNYKSRFQPQERLIGGQWRSVPD